MTNYSVFVVDDEGVAREGDLGWRKTAKMSDFAVYSQRVFEHILLLPKKNSPVFYFFILTLI